VSACGFESAGEDGGIVLAEGLDLFNLLREQLGEALLKGL